MTQKPLVSVLMTAYNSQAYIAQSISSILSQTLTDFELIIIDDASHDKTWKIIETYQKKDQRIIAFKNETNLGISANRNHLLNLARADFIAWQDADDISLSTRLEKQYLFLNNNPKVAICGSWLEFFNDQKKMGIRKYAQADASLRKKIFRYSPVAQPSAMARKSALLTVGAYNENLAVAEDLDLSFRLGQKYLFANLPEVLLKYREQIKSITFSKLKELEKNTLKIRLKYSKDSAYHFTIVDAVYNLMQFLTLYSLPPKLRVAIFNLIRNQGNGR